MSNKKKWRCSPYVAEQIKKGLRGNGCGAVGSPKLFSFYLTFGFGFDFTNECNSHDMEYSIPLDLKSDEHRAQADNYLEFNLALNVANHKPDPYRQWLIDHIQPYRKIYNKYKQNLPRVYHAAVTAGGYDAYWKIK